MHPRTYALMAVAAGASMFLALVGTNLIIDPQGMFGTGLLPRTINANERYERFVAYRAAPDTYDGLLFGSSRASIMPLDEVSRRMNGVKFASFAVAGGMLSDHLPVLEFVLREKARLGQRLRAVLMLIPPPLTGENPVRFWWRYLTAIQFRTWGSVIREARKKSRSAEAPKAGPTRVVQGIAAAATETVGPASAHAKPLTPASDPVLPPRRGISD